MPLFNCWMVTIQCPNERTRNANLNVHAYVLCRSNTGILDSIPARDFVVLPCLGTDLAMSRCADPPSKESYRNV